MQISVIEFSVENFKLFKDRVTFSMVARKNDKHTFESNSENLLKTSFIYGPNATGKTSLLDAFSVLKSGVLLSNNYKEDSTSVLPYSPCLSSVDAKEKPSFFEIVFSLDSGSYKGIYRYNFSFIKEKIVSENMMKISENGSEKKYITRKEQEIIIDDVLGGDMLSKNTRKEALVLTVAAQLNNPFAKNILEVLKNVNILSGIAYKRYQNFTIKKFKEDEVYKKKILEFLKKADFCISGGTTEEIDAPVIDIKDIEGEFSAIKRHGRTDILSFEHDVFDNDKKKISLFKLPLNSESSGTQKFFSVLGPVIDTLADGKVLVVDEFDNSLHPLLTKYIVDLFESEEVNNNNAQLIVTTHDTSLLSYKDDFIKDQFWFTEKDEFGLAKLFSLAEFDIRSDTEFSKKYLEGRFGALPFISSVKK